MAVERFEAPLAAVAADLRDGEVDPFSYVDELEDRIDATDPEIRALLSDPGRDERVRAEVAATRERFDGERPPLFSVPVGVKDIFHVRGMLTRGNSKLPPEVLTGPEAPAVSRLREAGAVVMAKTVTTEFAYMETGPTRNPHDTGHTPGGSSSGSAAAVAAGLVPLALGSQTGGSVLRPASFCGIVGFKPTYGRIPTEGVLPLAESLDHVGLFTQDVPGARLAASALCDGWAPVESVERPTLGVPDDAYLDFADEVGRRRFEGNVEALREAGYEVRHTSLFSDAEAISERHQTVMCAETALAHHEWFEAYGDRYREGTAEFIERGRDVSVGDLAAARAGQDALREEIAEVMADEGVDCWVTPAAPGTAPEGIDSTGNPVMNRFFTYVGVPAVSVPAGFRDGLPIGLQCVAGWGEGERLLAWADGLRAAVE